MDLAAQPSNDSQYLTRVDYIVSRNNALDVRFFRDDGDLSFQSGNVAPYAPNKQSLRVDNWAVHDTHTFSPTLLNELRLGVNRDNSLVRVLDNTQLSDLGAIFPGVITPQLPNVAVSGYYNLATTDIFSKHGNIYQIGNTLRWVRGKHSVSVGGEWERTEEFNRGSSGNQGSFSFDGSVTGVSFADFLIGKPVSVAQNSPCERLVKGWDWYVFAQDDIRLTPRLTVNLGLRYQWFEPYHAVYGRTNTCRAGQQSVVAPAAPPGMVFPGYQIPFLQNGNGWLPHIFGGWSLSGLTSITSGLPVYVISGRDYSLTGVGFDRPDLVGDPLRAHVNPGAERTLPRKGRQSGEHLRYTLLGNRLPISLERPGRLRRRKTRFGPLAGALLTDNTICLFHPPSYRTLKPFGTFI